MISLQISNGISPMMGMATESWKTTAYQVLLIPIAISLPVGCEVVDDITALDYDQIKQYYYSKYSFIYCYMEYSKWL